MNIKLQTKNNQFLTDVVEGLSRSPKKLFSKYFYDAIGDQLFQDIMNMPEYYLTNCEYEIFETHKQHLLNLIGEEPFDLIELGAGDGKKTKVLLQHFLEQGADFQYRPIDISANVLLDLVQDLKENLPELRVESLTGDYFEILKQLHQTSTTREVILFIGANIGNMTHEQSLNFLQHLHRTMSENDLLLIGFDLKKTRKLF